MSENGPTPPDDPAWVDDIVRRALERADGAADVPAATPLVSPTATPAPARPDVAPTRTTPTAPPEPVRAPEQRVRGQAQPTPQVATSPQRAPLQSARAARLSAPASVPPEAPAPMPAHGSDDLSRPSHPLATPNRADGAPMPQSSPSIDGRQQLDDRPQPQPEDLVSSRPYPADAPSGNAGPYPDAVGPDLFDNAVAMDHQDEDRDAMSSRMRGFLEWGAVVVGALAVALLIKTFLMQAYFIPSSSMESTLNVGDRVLVNKLSYQFGDIGRGDLVVFNRPPSQAEGEDDLIKRVIGLPGETVEISDGRVLITEVGSTEPKQLREPYLAEGVTTTGFVDTSGCASATPTTCVIPDGHVFVLGDNRPGSKDGRFFGPIAEDLVVGRAFLRVWPLADISFL